MTDKKEKILQVGLELFAKNGYSATSTSKIANLAGVSEGLIFRHFENKKGLLDAIIKHGEQKLNVAIAPIIFETDPQLVISKYIDLPFEIEEDEESFWRLQFKLKWQEEYYNPEKIKPLIDKLAWAFEQLGVARPAEEAKLFIQLIDAIATGILREGKASQLPFQTLLHQKYTFKKLSK